DGVPTFGLPNLQGRVPIHFGQRPGLSNYVLGQVGGVEGVTLDNNTMPRHTHAGSCFGNTGTAPVPANHVWASTSTGEKPYWTAAPDSQMGTQTINNTGGSQAHSNIQPYLVLNFIICLVGIFPSRN